MHFATFAWFGDQKFKFLFPSGVTANLPHWGTDDYPPLSPRAAARSALAFLDAAVPMSNASLEEFTLARAWGPQDDDRYWYYSIKLRVPHPEDVGADASLVNIPVLFNGAVPPCIALDADDLLL
jgi:hypothetical protein